MVWAIARPHWQLVLLDGTRKRCDFLRQAVERLKLNNVEVVWARAEDAGHNLYHREAYDVATARAVADTRVLAELCLPFVKVGGLWVAPKGVNPQAEVDAAVPAIKILGGRLQEVCLVDSLAAEGQRTALVVSKIQSTRDAYPRAPGTPNSKPLPA